MTENSNSNSFGGCETEGELLEKLRDSYNIAISEKSGQPIPLRIKKDDIIALIQLLNKQVSTDNPRLPILKEILRCLRNCVVLNGAVQTLIVTDKAIMNVIHIVLKQLTLDRKSDTCLNMLLTFLTNLIVNNGEAGLIVWDMFESDLYDLLIGERCVQRILPLIYNVLCKNVNVYPSGLLVKFLASPVESEYAGFLMEHLIGNNLIQHYYPNASTGDRVFMLEEMREYYLKDGSAAIPMGFALKLVSDFKRKSDCILKTVTDYLKDIEPREVALLLDIVASISGREEFLAKLQSDKSLLINCVFLLKSMHGVGKEGDNHFTAISKLSEMKTLSEDVHGHPAFGFKASLIRVLGNLVWNCRSNQDQLRELECIPLLLDCCNLDARNPLIIQWVIFAVRNLCELNLENQNIIAALTKQGVIDSATLNEMGMSLHDDGTSKINIVPLPRK